jgi:hypothetical protein
LAVWDELRGVLARLRDEQPGVLMMYAMPEADEGGPSPFVIRLAPWAAATAAELHRQFGDDVELTVGAPPHPPGRRLYPPGRSSATGPVPDLLDPDEIAAGSPPSSSTRAPARPRAGSPARSTAR